MAGAQEEAEASAIAYSSRTTFLGSGFICLMQMLTDLDSWGWVGTEGSEELCACVPSMPWLIHW